MFCHTVDAVISQLPLGIHEAYFLLGHGSEKLRQEWRPPLIQGEKLSYVSITELHCGSDAAAMKTKATRDVDCYILQGEKTSITLATQADVTFVFAKTDPPARARG